jgi:hypothetical protein
MVQLCELLTADEDDLGPVTEIFVHVDDRFALMCEDGKKWYTADLRKEVPPRILEGAGTGDLPYE